MATKSNKKKMLIFGVVALILIANFFSIFVLTRKLNIDNKNQISALTDTAKIYRDKEGKQIAEKSVFSGTKQEVLSVIQKDSREYKSIKETKGIKTYTNLKTITKIDTVFKLDSVKLDSSYYLGKKINDKYYTADIKLKNDSIDLKVTPINEYEFMHIEKSNGLFKPKSYIVSVKNLNPTTETIGLSTYEIKPSTTTKKKLGIAATAAAIIAGLILLRI